MNHSQYSDIILLPHPVSGRRQRMSRRNRAAQFAPFAALTGYEDAVSETARLTEQRAVLTEDACAALDERLQCLQEQLAQRPTVYVTRFVPDCRKEGGAYVTFVGQVRCLDFCDGLMVFADGTRLPLAEIVAMEGEVFNSCVLQHKFA